jgi:hypothetical protein
MPMIDVDEYISEIKRKRAKTNGRAKGDRSETDQMMANKETGPNQSCFLPVFRLLSPLALSFYLTRWHPGLMTLRTVYSARQITCSSPSSPHSAL